MLVQGRHFAAPEGAAPPPASGVSGGGCFATAQFSEPVYIQPTGYVESSEENFIMHMQVVDIQAFSVISAVCSIPDFWSRI